MTGAGGSWVRAGAMLAAAGLAGCVAPPPPPAQVPYVAVPGPGKTAAQFRQEDAACRADAVRPPPAPAAPGTVRPATSPAPGQPAAAPGYEVEPPGVAYLRCMAARNNSIEPLLPQPQPVYAYYPAYPIYVGAFGYGGYYPWLYGPGFYGFYGRGFGWRGYGYGYGYRGFGGGYYGGYRGGYGGGYRGGYGGGFHR